MCARPALCTADARIRQDARHEATDPQHVRTAGRQCVKRGAVNVPIVVSKLLCLVRRAGVPRRQPSRCSFQPSVSPPALQITPGPGLRLLIARGHRMCTSRWRQRHRRTRLLYFLVQGRLLNLLRAGPSSAWTAGGRLVDGGHAQFVAVAQGVLLQLILVSVAVHGQVPVDRAVEVVQAHPMPHLVRQDVAYVVGGKAATKLVGDRDAGVGPGQVWRS